MSSEQLDKKSERTSSTNFTWDELHHEILRQEVQELEHHPQVQGKHASLEHEFALLDVKTRLEEARVKAIIKHIESLPRPKNVTQRMRLDELMYSSRNALCQLRGFPGFENFPDSRLPLWQQMAALRAFHSSVFKEFRKVKRRNNWDMSNVHDLEVWLESHTNIAEREISTAYMLIGKAQELQVKLENAARMQDSTPLSNEAASRGLKSPTTRLFAALGRPYLQFRIFCWRQRVQNSILRRISAEDSVAQMTGKDPAGAKKTKRAAILVVLLPLASLVYLSSNWVRKKADGLRSGTLIQLLPISVVFVFKVRFGSPK